MTFDKLKAFAILIRLVSNFVFEEDREIVFTPTGLIKSFREYVNEYVSDNDLINWSKQI